MTMRNNVKRQPLATPKHQKYGSDFIYNVEFLGVSLDGRKATVSWDLEILDTDCKGQRITIVDSLEEENAFHFLRNCKAIGLPSTPLEAIESLDDAIGRKASLVFKRLEKAINKGRFALEKQHYFLPLLQPDDQETDFRMVS
jgi:hypothetical protein